MPEGPHPQEITRPSKHHFILIGEDGTDYRADGRDTIGVPLVERPESLSWDPFPEVSQGFRAACEQLAGVFPAGIGEWSNPYILFPDRWKQWREGFPTSDPGSSGVPPLLAESSEEIWALQSNYYGVYTLLQAPGRLVLGDYFGRARMLEDTSPEEWLARELEGGTPQQPARADM